MLIDDLWKATEFVPNPAQEEAIRHISGPLYLPAGPGSGKTRVLLWRALNLIVFNDIRPEEVFLSTFTEKAALQLKEGLRGLLGKASALGGKQYDISRMYVGTVHSLCQKLLTDRRFRPQRRRPKVPILLDELSQYLLFYQQWPKLREAVGFDEAANETVNSLFDDRFSSRSRHQAVTNCLSFFNRLTEECLTPERARQGLKGRNLKKLTDLYTEYRNLLKERELTDFAHLQREALELLEASPDPGNVFKYVIIDEYQDTNTIQEQLFFKLASGYRNICVVGDDDQALYRFRGATVENFVQFCRRCEVKLGASPKIVPLVVNYRSTPDIVNFYSNFIKHECVDWKKSPRSKSQFRVSKEITPNRSDAGPAVVASDPADPEAVAQEIASLVKAILKAKKVENENQIAFLFPSLKSAQVSRMKNALEKEGVQVYAPRAGSFLHVEESVEVFGLMALVFGRAERSESFARGDYEDYHEWLDEAVKTARNLVAEDPQLSRFIEDLKAEIRRVSRDYTALHRVVEENHWDNESPYDPDRMKEPFLKMRGLSDRSRSILGSKYFDKAVRRRLELQQRPFSLGYAVNRATSLDWTILDIFYRFCGFNRFRERFDMAARGDEGPICNLGLISRYLDTFVSNNRPIITGHVLADGILKNIFFGSYLYALHRRGESEYEDAEDPFPRGRIPFLTIHQAKGLEFPVVVLANPRKDDKGPQAVERLVSPLLRGDREPIEKIAEFDKMRMFYVALSRAKNLLVLAHFKSQGNFVSEPFKSILENEFPRIRNLRVSRLPVATMEKDQLPKTYSYTGDYLSYKRCPRNYMVFDRYEFAPSRGLTMFFGSLVHQTIEDLHQYLIAKRGSQ